MAEVMAHRGPDSRGTHAAPGVGLAVSRLSIIDVEGGDQPISSEDGAVTVVCNGEIYNYVELRRELEAAGHRFRTHSDTEVLVHLYEDDGADLVDRLRGMFGFALWDSRHRSLLLARDRLGIKPLYYHVSSEGLCFGSEIKAMLLTGQVEPRLDPAAVGDLFRLGFIREPGTFFAGVRRLLPGHCLTYREGAASIRRYWRVSFPPRDQLDSSRSAEDWATELRERLIESVRLHLRSDVPVAAWLSAGVDSSAIVALAAQEAGKEVDTFSLAFENPRFDEVTRQRTLASYNLPGVTNRVITCRSSHFEMFPKALWHCEQVSASGNEIPHMILAEATSPHYKVALVGEGSDEIFGGYGWYRVDKLLRPFAGLPRGLRRLMLLGPLIPRLFPGASRTHLADKEMDLERYRRMMGPRRFDAADGLLSGDLQRRVDVEGPSDGAPERPEEFDGWHPFTQLQYYEMTTRLPGFIIHHLDHSSMSHSVEARVPFLDHEVVEFCATIPPRLKMKRLYEKHILREAMRGVLPGEIRRRRKHGLRVPVEQWMRDDLPAFAEELLSERSLRDKGYFEPRAVRTLLDRHRGRAGHFGQQLLAVLAVQLWDETFIRNKGAAPTA